APGRSPTSRGPASTASGPRSAVGVPHRLTAHADLVVDLCLLCEPFGMGTLALFGGCASGVGAAFMLVGRPLALIGCAFPRVGGRAALVSVVAARACGPVAPVGRLPALTRRALTLVGLTALRGPVAHQRDTTPRRRVTRSRHTGDSASP